MLKHNCQIYIYIYSYFQTYIKICTRYAIYESICSVFKHIKFSIDKFFKFPSSQFWHSLETTTQEGDDCNMKTPQPSSN